MILFVVLIISISLFDKNENDNNFNKIEEVETAWIYNEISIHKVNDTVFYTSGRLSPQDALKAKKEKLKDYHKVFFTQYPKKCAGSEYAIITDTIDYYITSEQEQNLINDLMNKFYFEKDEFDQDGRQWVKNKKNPQYADVNSVYCYFSQIKGQAIFPRIVFRYSDDDWLFIRQFKINADGKIFTFVPKDMSRDNDSGVVWEWCDEEINSENIHMVEAIANSKSVKIRQEGSEYSKIRTITDREKTAIRETLELYKRLSGVFE